MGNDKSHVHCYEAQDVEEIQLPESEKHCEAILPRRILGDRIENLNT